MDLDSWAQILIGGGGFFALIRYMYSKQAESQEAFLNHLQNKNGIVERLGARFDETVRENSRFFAETTERFGNKIEALAQVVHQSHQND